MMTTKLNDSLFDQIERLATAPQDEIENEVRRSEAMCRLTAQVIDAGRVHVAAVKVAAEHGIVERDDVPQLLLGAGSRK